MKTTRTLLILLTLFVSRNITAQITAYIGDRNIEQNSEVSVDELESLEISMINPDKLDYYLGKLYFTVSF
ncbi:MAG: hypothetical protein JKY48_19015, partial [Flavobacteriales bacterium]|nr:hypothetical protein [Flavobacteriales bacterium]